MEEENLHFIGSEVLLSKEKTEKGKITFKEIHGKTFTHFSVPTTSKKKRTFVEENWLENLWSDLFKVDRNKKEVYGKTIEWRCL